MVINRNGTRWQYALTALGLVGVMAMATDAVALSSDRIPTQPIPPFPFTPPSTAERKQAIPLSPSLLTRKITCPAALKPLTVALLRDLPGYINRSNFRLASRQATNPTYAIVVSQPDFLPLPTDSNEYQSPTDANLHQVFFTVLERQYAGKQVVEFQQYHWLFLAQTVDGWQLALLFSRIGAYPSDRQPVTPPRDSSQSATAEAIRAWLRSCDAGAVKS